MQPPHADPPSLPPCICGRSYASEPRLYTHCTSCRVYATHVQVLMASHARYLRAHGPPLKKRKRRAYDEGGGRRSSRSGARIDSEASESTNSNPTSSSASSGDQHDIAVTVSAVSPPPPLQPSQPNA